MRDDTVKLSDESRCKNYTTRIHTNLYTLCNFYLFQ